MGSSAASSAGGNYQKIKTITTNNVKIVFFGVLLFFIF
jgi:hypothetical protein